LHLPPNLGGHIFQAESDVLIRQMSFNGPIITLDEVLLIKLVMEEEQTSRKDRRKIPRRKICPGHVVYRREQTPCLGRLP
jgi:hypothetical protein